MIIECENLAKRFRGHDAVRGVNLAVPQGAALGLIGANGAGKTTMLRLLLNVLTPDGGSARSLGVDSRHLRPRHFLRIGYVSENQKLPDRLTIAQYFAYLRSLYPNWDAALEASLRQQFDLPPHRALGKLSHGMRMKTMPTGALSFRPEVLLLDEPLSGLDPLVRDEVMEGLIGQAGETTIVISSHELAEIEGSLTHMAFMERGRVLFQDTIDDALGRFRSVSATLTRDLPRDAKFPDAWLSPRLSGQVLHFVDRAFRNEETLRQQLTESVGAVHVLSAEPMSLRDLSKELMRAGRTEARA